MAAHTERINHSRNIVILHIGDIARAAIQISLSKNIVAKLSYSFRDPYQISGEIGFGSHFVRKLNKPDSSELKFVNYDYIPFRRRLNHTHLLIQQIHAILIRRMLLL